jgi:hypothetical protein
MNTLTLEFADYTQALNDSRVADIKLSGMQMILKTGERLYLRNVNRYEQDLDKNMIFKTL